MHVITLPISSRQALRRTKTLRTLYWSVTGLFALLLLMAGIAEALFRPEGQQIMRHLGYPVHVLTVIGAGKVLAAVALVQPWFRTLKEWAYAGITFTLLGACAARASAGDSTILILSPLIFLAVMLLSYYLWKKTGSSEYRYAD
ncbi:DoxX family protein [Hymenobacter sp. BT175]|uniref:DoxX family protein n=1 Tax=Hymenobacter translucens TaxID=2886507 RepID=UPI001D0DF645|nr:DoxX family protein [Hymenobacter translucens]MCC2545921.1 DoxX family protein [Hymenobacter translucens]